MITNYKIVCLVQFNKIEFESSAILALSATVVSYYVEVVPYVIHAEVSK